MLNNLASLVIQQAFSKPSLVKLISKDTYLVFSIYCKFGNFWECFIFAKLCICENLAYAKFHENKTLVNLKNHSVVY